MKISFELNTRHAVLIEQLWRFTMAHPGPKFDSVNDLARSLVEALRERRHFRGAKSRIAHAQGREDRDRRGKQKECEKDHEKCCLVTDAGRIQAIPPASQRKLSADWAKGTSELQKAVSVGGVCVTPSSIIRNSLLTARNCQPSSTRRRVSSAVMQW